MRISDQKMQSAISRGSSVHLCLRAAPVLVFYDFPYVRRAMTWCHVIPSTTKCGGSQNESFAEINAASASLRVSANASA